MNYFKISDMLLPNKYRKQYYAFCVVVVYNISCFIIAKDYCYRYYIIIIMETIIIIISCNNGILLLGVQKNYQHFVDSHVTRSDCNRDNPC